MKEYWFLVPGFLFVTLALCPKALADAPVAQVKIISAAQSIATGTASAVFTIEAQDSTGAKVNVATTTRVNLSSDSSGGQFLTSSATGPCGAATTTSVTISNNTSHKSFCYLDLTSGSFTISIFVPDQPGVTGDSQAIILAGSPASQSPQPAPVPSPSPSPAAASSTSQQIIQSPNVKIHRFLPNPSGSDSENEWVEIKSQESQDVLLDGWLLDDKDTGGGPAADAFVLLGVITPGEVKRFMLPAGVFALNNTGGDEVNLYFSDSSLADKAEYSTVAYDDGIFELREGMWQPPVQVQPGGGGSSISPSPVVYTAPTDFRLNEVFPNPFGDDKGKEWVEIYNSTNATATLAGYFLANGDSETWSSKAWSVPTSTQVGPLGVIAVVLSKEVFSLSNSGTEKLKLFSPQKQLLDFVSYEDAPEGQSYFKDSKGLWSFGFSTFNKPNLDEPPVFSLFISELLANPGEDGEEFVEIYNPGSELISLESFTLLVGSKKKIFDAESKIEPSGYFTVFEDDLPSPLRNSGQTIKLLDILGREVSSVTYGAAKAGQSFGSQEGQNYTWTGKATPNEANEYVLGESVSVADSKTKTAPAVKAAAITTTQAKEIIQSNEDLKMQVAVLQESINQLASRLSPAQNPPMANIPTSDEIQPPQKQLPIGRILIWPAAFAALGGAVFVTFKKIKK